MILPVDIRRGNRHSLYIETLLMENEMRDFSAKTRKALARKGITIVRAYFVPDENGTFVNGSRHYVVNDNGCQRIMSFFDVLTIVE